MARYLVVAHQTADSEELVSAVRDIVEDEPEATFHLVVPATPVEHLFTWTEGETFQVAEERTTIARAAVESVGARVVDARVGDADPVHCVRDALLRHEFDVIVMATLPPGISRWLGMDAVHRVERAVDVPVLHVVAESKAG